MYTHKTLWPAVVLAHKVVITYDQNGNELPDANTKLKTLSSKSIQKKELNKYFSIALKMIYE